MRLVGREWSVGSFWTQVVAMVTSSKAIVEISKRLSTCVLYMYMHVHVEDTFGIVHQLLSGYNNRANFYIRIMQ